MDSYINNTSDSIEVQYGCKYYLGQFVTPYGSKLNKDIIKICIWNDNMIPSTVNMGALLRNEITNPSSLTHSISRKIIYLAGFIYKNNKWIQMGNYCLRNMIKQISQYDKQSPYSYEEINEDHLSLLLSYSDRTEEEVEDEY